MTPWYSAADLARLTDVVGQVGDPHVIALRVSRSILADARLYVIIFVALNGSTTGRGHHICAFKRGTTWPSGANRNFSAQSQNFCVTSSGWPFRKSVRSSSDKSGWLPS